MFGGGSKGNKLDRIKVDQMMMMRRPSLAEDMEDEKEGRLSCLKLLCWKSQSGRPNHRAVAEETGRREEFAVTAAGGKPPGGWKTMPFILGNETCERMATFSMLGNLMVYLMREYHMSQADAANLINIWTGFQNFAPLLGAFLADAYFGRFWVIGISSLPSFLGILVLTLTAWLPGWKPPKCAPHQSLKLAQCHRPTSHQLQILNLGLGLLSVGSGGIRPCSIPFGVDQFDSRIESNRRGINSYYNWYYTTFTLVFMLCLTVMVYVQNNISWAIGFGIPAVLMFSSIIIFFIGYPRYVLIKPQGSVFSSVPHVAVAAFRKRRARLPAAAADDDENDKRLAYYDPPLPENSAGIPAEKLPLTDEYGFLNKAAVVFEGDLQVVASNAGATSTWSLCSVQSVEEVKLLLKVLPIWISGVICFMAVAQQNTFTVSQAMAMERRIGRSFVIPPGSVGAVSLFTVALMLPIYDRLVVPYIRRYTRVESGITNLQRMGIGLVFSIFAMTVAGMVEVMRRDWALRHHDVMIHPQQSGEPDSGSVGEMSVFWLVPQLVFMGLTEGFNFIGQIEFYNKEFPDNMRSVATSFFFCSIAGANYLGSLVIVSIHRFTGNKDEGRPDWLADDLNKGRLDNYYYLLASMACVNMMYFLWVSRCYKYKKAATAPVIVQEPADNIGHNGNSNTARDFEFVRPY